VNWLVAWLAPALLLAIGWMVGFGPAGSVWANPSSWLVLLLLVVVTATDLSARRIPNWATYTAMAWGALAQLILAFYRADPPGQRFGFPSLAEAILGFLLGFVVFFVLVHGVGRWSRGCETGGCHGVIPGTGRFG